MSSAKNQGAGGGRMIDVLISGGLLVAGVTLFASTFGESFEVRTFGGDVGPAFAPRIFLGAWIIFAALALGQAHRSTAERTETIRKGQLALILVISALTALAMIRIGFLLAMAPGMAAFILALGYRNPLPVLLASVLGPVVVWALFTFVFELYLPRSPWFHLI